MSNSLTNTPVVTARAVKGTFEFERTLDSGLDLYHCTPTISNFSHIAVVAQKSSQNGADEVAVRGVFADGSVAMKPFYTGSSLTAISEKLGYKIEGAPALAVRPSEAAPHAQVAAVPA